MGCAPPGCDAAVAHEAEQIRLERQRLWYVAGTRARDLILLPRVSCDLPANAWANAVELALQNLPPFGSEGLPASSLPPMDRDRNTQDRPTFETEAALVTSLATNIVRVTPSRAEAEPASADALVFFSPDLPEVPEPNLPQGGRGRGLILHKLIEEVLTGEVDEDATALEERAGELTATCDLDIGQCEPGELAATVVRTLALPKIVELRPRLLPELTVYASVVCDSEEQVTVGIADAIVLTQDGPIEVVVDWKSDVAPTAQAIEGYRGQVSAYIRATGAQRGLIVLMTSGTVIEVTA
jgi:exodeoxyribonuclease-5